MLYVFYTCTIYLFQSYVFIKHININIKIKINISISVNYIY